MSFLELKYETSTDNKFTVTLKNTVEQNFNMIQLRNTLLVELICVYQEL